MSATAAAATSGVISKAEFARRRNVTPGRVSQWISAGKISGAALVGEGRNAQIDEAIACEQLRRSLDPLQMAGNGLTTQLRAPAAAVASVLPFEQPSPAASSALPTAPPDQVDTIEDRIKRQRLEQIERQNRNEARDEAERAGRLTDAAIAKQVMGREISKLLTMFEGSLSDFATAISAQFKLPQRDVLHLLRGEFRKFRAETAADARARADALPAIDAIDLDAEREAAAVSEPA